MSACILHLIVSPRLSGGTIACGQFCYSSTMILSFAPESG